MKKHLLAMLLVLLLALTACDGTPVKEEPAQPEEQPISQPQEEPVDPDLTEVYPVTLYLPNENADGFDRVTGMLFSNDAQALVEALVTYDVLPAGTSILDFTQSEGDLSLDLSEEFLSAFSNTGTAGEQMVLGSLVCTFLNHFEAEQLRLTCQGEMLQTGHNIYDWPLTMSDCRSD